MTSTNLCKTLAVIFLVIAGIDIDRFLIGQTDSVFGTRWGLLFFTACALAVGIYLMNQKARA